MPTTDPLIRQLNVEAQTWAGLMFSWNRSRGPTTCCKSPMYGPVLKWEVWQSIAKKPTEEILCKACMERRLGRRLRDSDLDPCPWNVARAAFVIVSNQIEEARRHE